MAEKIVNIGARPAIDTIAKELGTGLIGAEVGVNKGYNAAYICNTVKPKMLYLIDPWNNFFDPASGEVIGEIQFILTQKNLSRFPCCQFIRDTSFGASEKFGNEKLDFVYIDADHSYPAVLSDIARWYPKVRQGGIIGGHDFTTDSVRQAVMYFCEHTKIGRLYHQHEDWWIIK